VDTILPSDTKSERIVDSGVIGAVKLVQADFGLNFPDFVKAVSDIGKGGGSLFAIGVYPINLASFVFNDQKPNLIQATGTLSQTGVDQHVSIFLRYGLDGHCTITSSLVANLLNDALIVGTKGMIRIHGPFWHTADRLTLTDSLNQNTSYHFPRPAVKGAFNFANSEGLLYEAEEVHECLRSGKLESEVMNWKATHTVLDILDQIRQQIGFHFPNE